MSEKLTSSQYPFNKYYEMKKCIVLLVSLLVAYDAVSILRRVCSITIPILGELLGFLLLTFIPGYLAYRILSIRTENPVLSLIFIMGLSLSLNVISGLVLALIGAIFNLKLISFNVLILYYNVFVVILLIALYLCGDIKCPCFKVDGFRKNILKLGVLIFTPLISIISLYLVNYYNWNNLVILLIILIALMPFLYRYDDYHWTLVLSASFSILISYHLVSDYLWGWDIHYQYYCANQVFESGLWNLHQPSSQNSLLSLVILAPIYSIMLNLDLVWVFKLIYPLIFCTVPLLIYFVADKISQNKYIAYLSSFIFIFYYGFFKDMIDKQFVAEFFLLLLVIVLIIYPRYKLLSILFATMLIFSHYGVSWIFFIALLVTISICEVVGNNKYFKKIGLFVIFLGVMLIFWESITSSGTTFANIIDVSMRVMTHISDILSPDARSGVSYLSYGERSIFWKLYTILNGFVIILIAFGLGIRFWKLLDRSNNIQFLLYEILSLIFFTLIVAQSVITFGLGMDRIIQITLTILALYAIIGFIFLFDIFNRIFQIKLKNKNIILSLFALFLCTLFLFNSGLINYITNDPLPYSINLHQNPEWQVYATGEVDTLKWLKNSGISRDIAIINPFSAVKSRDGSIINGIFEKEKLLLISPNTTNISNSYIYFGKCTSYDQNYSLFQHLVPRADLIYTNQISHIYLI